MAAVVQDITNDQKPEGQDLIHIVTLSEETSQPTVFSFSITGGLGEGGSASNIDYGSITFSNGVNYSNNEIIIPIGVISFTVTIPTITDTDVETDESIIINVGGIIGIGTILNNDPKPIPTITDHRVVEGEELKFEVGLSFIPTTPIVYEFSIGGTVNEIDYGFPKFTDNVIYNSQENTITVPAGLQNFKIFIPTIRNDIAEPDETLIVQLDSYQGTGIIEDDQPVISIDVDSEAVKEGNGAVFYLLLNKKSINETTVTIVVAGSAAPGIDYAPTITTTQTISANTLVKTFNVATIAGDSIEGIEEIIVTISNAITNNKNLTISEGIATASIIEATSTITTSSGYSGYSGISGVSGCSVPSISVPYGGSSSTSSGVKVVETRNITGSFGGSGFAGNFTGESVAVAFDYTGHFNLILAAIEKIAFSNATLTNNMALVAQRLCEIEQYTAQIADHLGRIRNLAEDDGIHMRRPHEWLIDGSSFIAKTRVNLGNEIRTDVILKNTGNYLEGFSGYSGYSGV